MFAQATKTGNGGSGVKMTGNILDPGSYPARVVQIVDLGMQPGSSIYPEPKLKMEMRFELLDEFMVDEEGKELESKPRWFSYELTYNADGYMGERSNISKVFEALDGFDKPLPELLGKACNVAIAKGVKQDGKTPKNKITGVAAMRQKDVDKYKDTPLQNPTTYFSLMTPDMEVWKKLSSKGQYSQQSKIKASLELHLTPLAALLATLNGEKPKGEEDGEHDPILQNEDSTSSDTESGTTPDEPDEPGKVDAAADVFD